MSPLTSFHRIAHDTFSSFLLSLDGSFLLGSEDVVNTRISLWWEQARAIVVVPFFKFLVALCLIMSVMYFVEVMYMGIVVAYVKLFKRKPEKVYKWEAMENDAECGSKSFPMVLVQIPMYNEKEVCEQSIAAACRISWPSNCIIIQVLDDSTDPASKELVRRECERWSRQGVNITFEIRDNRNGYKAGALREGMKHSYVKQCDYIAIFDADFQPEPDFLHPLNESGGWNDQTTVEDMDVAVRATLRGWKLLYIDDLKVKSELPCSFNALRSQQHRWTCGPANLFRKMAGQIIRSENVSLWKKLYMLYSFFFMRKVVAHILTFCFYCVILPATVLFPEVTVPKWAAFYLPALITLFIAIGKPRSVYLLVLWVLFENAMSMLRTKALVMGFFETGRVQEWVVTEKLGDGLKTKLIGQVSNEHQVRFRDRVHFLELLLGVYLLFCGCYDIIYGKNRLYLYVYLLMQSTAFFVVGFGFVGK
ncbi:hypothetical protein HID58_062957 [Brassica napus]|uniref:Glycosyltransferase 2-like domain-containing protein n=1 Tax=Brassica napus TaxID=3708 RepID=A0ABQ8A2V5_BRANA|nr:hypothetical protein HID58_062957 [Brassica napus]